MKKYILITLSLLMLLFTSCNESIERDTDIDLTTKEIESEEIQDTAIQETYIYSDILDEYFEFINEADTMNDCPKGGIGVAEIVGFTFEEAKKYIGYTIRDINSDTIPELLIVTTDKYVEDYYGDLRYDYGTEILCAFTDLEGEVKLVFEGMARNSYYLMKDGRIFNEGSGGAAYSMFGTFTFGQGDASLTATDYYFTDYGYDEITYHYNTTGNSIIEESQKLDIDSEEFIAISKDLARETVKLDYTDFNSYR